MVSRNGAPRHEGDAMNMQTNLANYHQFTTKYRELTRTDETYADAVWHSLTDEARGQPEKTAVDMAAHFHRLRKEQDT